MSEEAPKTEPTWPRVHKLKHPIDFAGERIAALTFRRGKLGDIKGMKLEGVPPVDHLLLIASRMCGTPVAALEMLDGDDAEPVLEIALTFFTKCLGAGS